MHLKPFKSRLKEFYKLPTFSHSWQQWLKNTQNVQNVVFEFLPDQKYRLLQSAAQRALRSERRSQKWERERERRSLKKMGARARAALWKKAERRERRSFSLFALFNSVTSSRT